MSSDDFVGLRIDVATVEAYNNGFDVVRVVERDGTKFFHVPDFRLNRINFKVEQQLVVAASVG